MFKRIYLSLLPLIFFVVLPAQDQKNIFSNDQGSESNVLYRNDASGKIYANTRGYGLLYRRGKHITGTTRSYYEVDFQTLRHPKEVKVAGTAENRKRFVYGKLNSVFLLRAALGMQHVIYKKADLKAVEIRCSYSIGPTIAFAKPYYVQVYRNSPRGARDPDEVRFNQDSFTQDSVIGKGAFTKGLAETVIYPGLSGKFNLSFEYASYTDFIRAIETGISIDYFPKALPIMARNPTENVIITLHVGFVFGRKWF
ncbi:MAG: hypothetical protein H0W61_13915 [Bacteroidetes bacterium]|nr:hypothetical protein [Bacteroidota bacterium]